MLFLAAGSLAACGTGSCSDPFPAILGDEELDRMINCTGLFVHWSVLLQREVLALVTAAEGGPASAGVEVVRVDAATFDFTLTSDLDGSGEAETVATGTLLFSTDPAGGMAGGDTVRVAWLMEGDLVRGRATLDLTAVAPREVRLAGELVLVHRHFDFFLRPKDLRLDRDAVPPFPAGTAGYFTAHDASTSGVLTFVPGERVAATAKSCDIEWDMEIEAETGAVPTVTFR